MTEVGFFAIFGLLGAGVGLATGAATRSVSAGVATGVLAAIAGGVHTMHVWLVALSEEGVEPAGYDGFALDHFGLLLAVYMVGPAVFVTALRLAWRWR